MIAGEAFLDVVFEAFEGAAADEEDVGGVDLQEILVGVLAAALGGDIGDAAFNDFEERLLDTFARDIAGDAGVIALAGDLVDFVDVDDALLAALYVPIGVLQQAQDDVFDVLAHVTGFGQRGGVDDGERDVQNTRQGLRE